MPDLSRTPQYSHPEYHCQIRWVNFNPGRGGFTSDQSDITVNRRQWNQMAYVDPRYAPITQGYAPMPPLGYHVPIGSLYRNDSVASREAQQDETLLHRLADLLTNKQDRLPLMEPVVSWPHDHIESNVLSHSVFLALSLMFRFFCVISNKPFPLLVRVGKHVPVPNPLYFG